MKGRILRIAAVFGTLLVMVMLGAVALIYSGLYDIAATTPHFEFTSRVLRTALEQSVKRKARDVKAPELDDPEKVHMGFRYVHEMCVVCHGAPGVSSSQLSKGLYPEAPDLAKAAKGWEPAELFVIVRDGIKMSGMPAWSPTHSGEELWAMVAFLKVLPTMPPNEYQAGVEYYKMSPPDMGAEPQAGHH